MGLKQVRFATELRRLNKVGLDTSILIYHLEDITPYAEGAVLGRTKATL